MRNGLVLVALLACGGSSFGDRTTGDQGKASFSYVGVIEDAKVDEAIIPGAQVTVRIRLASSVSTASVIVSSDKTDVLTVDQFGKDTNHPGEWEAQVTSRGVGQAKLKVTNAADSSALDSVTIKVAEPAKIDAPASVNVSVNGRASFEAHVKDASGAELYAPYALAWALDQDVAQFQLGANLKGPTYAIGDKLTLQGARPGPTTLHGTLGKLRADVAVNVSK